MLKISIWEQVSNSHRPTKEAVILYRDQKRGNRPSVMVEDADGDDSNVMTACQGIGEVIPVGKRVV